jgi:hypothetical protein
LKDQTKEVVVPPSVTLTEIEPNCPEEAPQLASEMLQSFRRQVKRYRFHYGLPESQAKQHVASGGDEDVAALMDEPNDQVKWWQLDRVSEKHPEKALEKWEEIKRQAQAWVATGHTGARAIDRGEPWGRATYLGIRAELAREWNPRNGIEQTLIDTMAQAYMMQLRWLAAHVNWMDVESFAEADGTAYSGKVKMPRMTTLEGVQNSAALADRYQRMFLRALRHLRDMRRYPVTIQNAGQVNVASQQVNSAQVGHLDTLSNANEVHSSDRLDKTDG